MEGEFSFKMINGVGRGSWVIPFPPCMFWIWSKKVWPMDLWEETGVGGH